MPRILRNRPLAAAILCMPLLATGCSGSGGVAGIVFAVIDLVLAIIEVAS
jgi:hypothetical protein